VIPPFKVAIAGGAQDFGGRGGRGGRPPHLQSDALGRRGGDHCVRWRQPSGHPAYPAGNAHSAAPIAVPAPVTAAVHSTAAADAIRGSSPFLCFLARVVEHLEAGSAPMSSYTGVFSCLRATLADHFTGISVAQRRLLQGALERRFTSL